MSALVATTAAITPSMTTAELKLRLPEATLGGLVLVLIADMLVPG